MKSIKLEEFTVLRNNDTSKLYLEWKQILSMDDYGSRHVDAFVLRVKQARKEKPFSIL